MRPDEQDSLFSGVLELLDMIWSPGLKAMNVQKALKVQSLEDTVRAAQQAGYEVAYVDLPEMVSGFATVIDGQPFIVVNRTKPRSHVAYTVCHELAHHILHLEPSCRPNSLGIPTHEGMEEFEANMFAASLVLWTASSDEKDDVLRKNQESVILILSIFLSLGVIVAALGFHLWSRLSKKRQLAQPVP